MKITQIPVGYLEANCYILEKDGKILIIDPGDDYDKIKQKIQNKKIIKILITHHHQDHIGAINYFDNNLILHEILECANDVGRTITSNTFTLEINTDNSITDNNLNAILKKSPEKIEESSNIISTDLKNALDNNSLK